MLGKKCQPAGKNFIPREKISTNEIIVLTHKKKIHPREHEPTIPAGHETHEIYETHKSVQDLYP